MLRFVVLMSSKNSGEINSCSLALGPSIHSVIGELVIVENLFNENDSQRHLVSFSIMLLWTYFAPHAVEPCKVSELTPLHLSQRKVKEMNSTKD